MTVTLSTFVSKACMLRMHVCQNMKHLHNFTIKWHLLFCCKAIQMNAMMLIYSLSEKDNITFQERDKKSASIAMLVLVANNSNSNYFLSKVCTTRMYVCQNLKQFHYFSSYKAIPWHLFSFIPLQRYPNECHDVNS